MKAKKVLELLTSKKTKERKTGIKAALPEKDTGLIVYLPYKKTRKGNEIRENTPGIVFYSKDDK